MSPWGLMPRAIVSVAPAYRSRSPLAARPPFRGEPARVAQLWGSFHIFFRLIVSLPASGAGRPLRCSRIRFRSRKRKRAPKSPTRRHTIKFVHQWTRAGVTLLTCCLRGVPATQKRSTHSRRSSTSTCTGWPVTTWKANARATRFRHRRS